MLCISSARFNLTAKRLVQGDNNTDPTDSHEFENGSYVYQQDPDTGAFIRVWVEDPDITDTVLPDDLRIPCIARGVVDGGIRVAGTTERYTPAGIYENVDFVRMQFPAGYILTKRDKVTDIRNGKNILLWKEEEFDGAATVFDVLGVTPIIDPFGNHVENTALLQRSEVQGG
jgi:hypothetical protein